MRRAWSGHSGKEKITLIVKALQRSDQLTKDRTANAAVPLPSAGADNPMPKAL